jgi:maltooligosyltrehalose trehalohydrolase
VIAENERQETRLVRPPPSDGYGLDALWNDDFHHSARVALTGRSEAYYSGYRGTPQELLSAAKYGYLYQGQWYAWQHNGRGTPALDLPPRCFVNFIQNHDQVANGDGRRIHALTSPGKLRAITALLLLLPQTPMLFQGQEFAASTPFYYFADHHPELAKLVRQGRTEFLSQFPSLATPAAREAGVDPTDQRTFDACVLDWNEREQNAAVVALHRGLIRLRHDDVVFRAQRHLGLDGAVLGDQLLVLRFFGSDGDDRLLFVNLGARCHADPAAEPLVAPPLGMRWETIFSTDDPRYGGWGTPPVDTQDDGWWIPAECAVVLTPVHRG